MFEGKIENSKAVEYLINERKINKGVVDYFLNKGMLYQDIRNNCVFKTDDFACVRSTGGKRFVLDAKGCDYNKGFFFKAKETANQLFVAESVIDIMSVMSVRAMNNRNYEDSMYLALSGVEKTDCIYNHLKKENKVEIVNLCFDNDKAGNRACEEVMAKLADEYPNVKAVACYPPRTKDWNEYLVDISTPKEEKQMSLSDYQEAIAERKKNNPLENRKDNSIQKENKVEDRSR